MNELSLLAKKHDTDKGVEGLRWEDTYHGFTEYYHDYLKHLRDEKFVLLEIGVGGYDTIWDGGQSLKMWAEYFPNADIHGLDLYDKEIEGRFITHQGSQADENTLLELISQIGRPKIIIDDGSHIDSHIRTSYDTLFPLLAEGGIYIIEDAHVTYTPEGDEVTNPIGDLSFLAYMRVIDKESLFTSIHFHYGFIIIKK